VARGIKDKVAIIGMGCSRFGERWDSGPDDLMVEAFNLLDRTNFGSEAVQAVPLNGVVHFFHVPSIGQTWHNSQRTPRSGAIPCGRLRGRRVAPAGNSAADPAMGQAISSGKTPAAGSSPRAAS